MIKYKKEDAVQCLPAGDYMATLASADETTSRSGNPMYKLAFTVYGPKGENTVYEYVVIPTFVFKLKRLARALGVEAEFEAEKFDPAKYVGKNVTLTLTVEEQDGFDAKNAVKAYAPSNGSKPPAPAAESEEAFPWDETPAPTAPPF